MPDPQIKATGRLVFGLIVIALGVIFTLDEMGIFDAGEVLRWWPAVLLAYGLTRLTGTWCRPNPTAGVVLTLIGGWLLLRNLHVLPYGLRDLWPLLLIAFGATLVAGGLRRSRGMAADAGADAASTVSGFAFWSGSDRRVVTDDFKGGDLTAVMGGHDVDLRAAKIKGESAVIDLLVMMGGVDIRIPEDWTVTSEAVPIMGAVEDHTHAPAGEVRGRLVLRGFVMMGGVEIKN
jgi:predicted membrane protein